MSEKNPKTFRETVMSDESRQSVMSALKAEGFDEEQLNAMPSEKVWKLYIGSQTKIVSDEIAGMAKILEGNPHLASMFNPLIKKLRRQLEDWENTLEEEIAERKEKEGTSHE